MNAMGMGLSWRNYVQAGAGTFNDIEGSEFSEVALASLLDPALATQAVGNEIAGETPWYIDYTFSETDLPCRLIGLLNHSETNAVVPVTAMLFATASAVTPVWSVDTLWLPPRNFQPHTWYLRGSNVSAHRVRFQGFGPGRPCVGGMWVGPWWGPTDGIESTWRTGLVDPGSMSQSAGLQGYPRVRPRARTLSGRFIEMSLAVALGSHETPDEMDFQRLLYEVGKTDRLVMMPRTRDANGNVNTAAARHLMHRLAVHGSLQGDLPELEHAGADKYRSTPWKIQELL